MSLSREAFRGLCVAAGFVVRDREVSTETSILRSEELGGIENTMVDVLEAHHNVTSTREFRDECVNRGVNRHSFWLYLSYSPLLERLAPGVYTLRGSEVDPARVAEVAGRNPASTQSLQDHGWTKDGAVWIGYEVTTSVFDSGVVSIPASVGQVIGEKRLELFAIDGSVMGTLVLRNTTGWGLSPFISRRGVDIGDYILVTLDTELGVAMASSGPVDLLVTFQEGEGWGPRHYLEAVTEPA